ncbi:MAG TPA: hypothetical protein PLJ88_08645 [Agitococcus sp.]|nr:hypothetical protein [Pseudomonadales bacterium]MCB1673316.1 hypothetical protein [Pseudomonadales bacterium]MCP5176498.1 hypothetical protein [Moraxellaceae bacterium]HQV23139.1 hypothetical protein [Agitococcus sp.]
MNPKTLLVCLTCLSVTNIAIAAEKSKPVKKESSTSVDISNGTDIVGSKDAPLVLNIVPWKEKEHTLPKNPLSPSVLQQSAKPIDPDIELRETGYSRALQELLPLSTVNP